MRTCVHTILTGDMFFFFSCMIAKAVGGLNRDVSMFSMMLISHTGGLKWRVMNFVNQKSLMSSWGLDGEEVQLSLVSPVVNKRSTFAKPNIQNG